eukprot:g363.t1
MHLQRPCAPAFVVRGGCAERRGVNIQHGSDRGRAVLPRTDTDNCNCSTTPNSKHSRSRRSRATGATLGSSSGSTAATRSGPPNGTGPLFQCAVCAGLVYESQLEYHMTICKEPEDAPVLKKVEPGSVSFLWIDLPEDAENTARMTAKEQRASSLSAQSVDRGTSPAKPAANHGPPNKATSSPTGTLGSARRQLQLDPPLEVEQQRRDREQDTRPPTVLPDRDTRARLPTTSTENDRNSTDTQGPPTTNPMIPASPSSPVPPAFVAGSQPNASATSPPSSARGGAGTGAGTASLRAHRGKEMDRVTRENIKQHSAEKWRLQREQYKAQGEAHELAECTFRPRHVEHKLLNTSTLAASSYYSPGSVVIGEQQLRDALMKTSAPTPGEKPASRGRTTANHRTKRELEQYRQEKYEKEMKECTFRPIVNSELNRYILAESAANLFSDPENYLENEQERKKKKLVLIEKEAYRECTHKPTISNYAQKHSKGGHNHRTGAEDALVERGEQENVHDRLYSAYTIAQTAKTGLLEELMSSSTNAVGGAPAGGEEGVGGARGKRAGTSKQQRSGSKGKRSGSDEGGGAGAAAAKSSGGATNAGKKASNLLYSDAVARQKKRKEQTADQGKMPHSPGRVCSARSRRYYWHLLEKKVREAFQVAVAAREDHTSAPGELHFTDLPLFLEEMGCVERRAGARGAAAGTNINSNTGRNKDDGDDKRNQLHLSLWRVLDPEARGCTDLLALTVFFHVLMGAVDDDTFKSLQQGHAGDSSADSDADVEAQRIRGLVSQYDPQKLRQEFGLFYFNRLHNTSRSGGPLTAPSGPGGSCATAAATSSGQGLSNKVTQRLKEESGVMTHVDLLLWRQKKNQEKLQKQRTEKEEREKKEAREMQFFQRRGKKNSKEQQVVEVDVQTRAAGTRGRKPSARAKGKGKGAYSTPQERTVDVLQAVQVLTSSSLYERGMHQKEKLAENVKIAQQLQQDRELAACSFKPNVEVAPHAANAASTNVRGYEETTSRMRRAFDAKSELRRWQETRAPRTDKKASSVAALREMKKRVFSPPSRANKKEDHVEDEGEEEAVVMLEKEHAGARAGGGRGGAGGARGRAPKMSNYYTSEEEHYVQPGPARAQNGAATTKTSSSANRYNRSRRRIMEVVDHHAETDHNEQEQEEFVDFLSRSAAPAKALPQSQNQKFRPRPRSTSGGPRKNLHAAYQALGQSRRRRRAAESDEDENVLLYVDVNISPTETDRLVVYRGQKPHEAAKKFAEKHGLSGHLTKKLNYLLAARHATSRGPQFDRKGGASISRTRLEELIDAEILSLGLVREPRVFTLDEILAFTDAEKLGEVLLSELPVRFAHRIKLLSGVIGAGDGGGGPSKKNPFADVRELYVQSFKDLKAYQDADEDADAETEVEQSKLYRLLTTIHKRHSKTTRLLLGGKTLLEQDGVGLVSRGKGREGSIRKNQYLNELLDKLFLGRISTKLLIRRYLELASPDSNYIKAGAGIIDPWCDVGDVVARVVHEVSNLVKLKYNAGEEILAFDVRLPARTISPVLPYPTNHLYFILFEVLKNAATASMKAWRTDKIQRANAKLHPASVQKKIEVVVTGDEFSCAIRVRDQGHGIPDAELPFVWNYLHSTETTPSSSSSFGSDLLNISSSRGHDKVDEPLRGDVVVDEEDDQDTLDEEDAKDVLSAEAYKTLTFAGGGCGLPLASLYARYLGGSLDLHTVVGVGTDVVLFMSRVQGQMESTMSLCLRRDGRLPAELRPVSFTVLSSTRSVFRAGGTEIECKVVGPYERKKQKERDAGGSVVLSSGAAAGPTTSSSANFLSFEVTKSTAGVGRHHVEQSHRFQEYAEWLRAVFSTVTQRRNALSTSSTEGVDLFLHVLTFDGSLLAGLVNASTFAIANLGLVDFEQLVTATSVARVLVTDTGRVRDPEVLRGMSALASEGCGKIREALRSQLQETRAADFASVLDTPSCPLSKNRGATLGTGEEPDGKPSATTATKRGGG